MAIVTWSSILIAWAVMTVFAIIWEGPGGLFNLLPNSPSAGYFGVFLTDVFNAEIITEGGGTGVGIGGVVDTAIQFGNFAVDFALGLGKLLTLDFGYFKLNDFTRFMRLIVLILFFGPISIGFIQYLFNALVYRR